MIFGKFEDSRRILLRIKDCNIDEQGAGYITVLKLAAEGVKVGIHYYQDETAANNTLAGVRRAGSDGVVVQADVTRAEEVQGLFDRIWRGAECGRCAVRPLCPRPLDTPDAASAPAPGRRVGRG